MGRWRRCWSRPLATFSRTGFFAFVSLHTHFLLAFPLSLLPCFPPCLLPPLLAPILKQYGTHIPVDIGMERDVGRNTKVKEMVNSFKELRASWGSRTCKHAPCRQDWGGVLQGREQRRERPAPHRGVRGRRGTQPNTEPFPNPARHRFCAGDLLEGEVEAEILRERDGGHCLA